MQPDTNSIKKILKPTIIKILLALVFLFISTIYSSAPDPNNPSMFDYFPTLYGFPLKYLEIIRGLTNKFNEINYLFFTVDLIFWYIISGLLIRTYNKTIIKN